MSSKRLELEQRAVDTVQRIGLSNLSFRTLAEEAGIKSSSVHYYFPEKAHLADAVINHYGEAFFCELDLINRKHRSPEKQIDAFIKIFEDVVNDDKFCLCGMMAAEIDNLHGESRALLMQYFNRAEDWLYQVFKSEPPQRRTGIKPRQLARIVMAGLEGAILIDRVEGKPTHLRAQRELIRGFFK